MTYHAICRHLIGMSIYKTSHKDKNKALDLYTAADHTNVIDLYIDAMRAPMIAAPTNNSQHRDPGS